MRFVLGIRAQAPGWGRIFQVTFAGCLTSLLAADPSLGDDALNPNGAHRAGRLIVRVQGLVSTDANRPETDGIVAIDPNDGSWRQVAGAEVMRAALSPDGRQLACTRWPNAADPEGVWIYDMKGEMPPHRVFERAGRVVWSSDGRNLVVSYAEPPGAIHAQQIWKLNADGTERSRLPMPDHDLVIGDWSSDRQWFAGLSMRSPNQPDFRSRFIVVHPDGTGLRVLHGDETRGSCVRFSPSGTRLAYLTDTGDADNRRHRLCFSDVDGENKLEIPIPITLKGKLNFPSLCWSPDGSCFAVGEWQTGDECRIELLSLQGVPARKLTLKCREMVLFDWR